MAEIAVTAVVLRRHDTGESDRRVTYFTRELGKIEAIAKGARKSGSRLAGASEPLMVAQLQIAQGKVRNFVTQSQPVSSLPRMRSSYERLLVGQAIAELVAAHFPLHAPDQRAFDDLLLALNALGGDTEPQIPLTWYAARTLAQEGLMPDWQVCASSHSPVQGHEAWVSAVAGGRVSPREADRFYDTMRVEDKTLIAVTKTSELEAPPPRLKGASECTELLHMFWQAVIGSELPAWGAVVRAHTPNGV